MSLEFNSSFYLAQYPDIADAGIDPQFHFENYGAAEGRAPNATLLPVAEGFDEQAYRDANQDVNAAIENGQLTSGYQHWVLYGRFEESRPEATFNDGIPVSEAPPASIDALFNAEEYLELNPDVAAAGIDAYEHFVNYGSAEGRAPNAAYAEIAANFDGQAYRDANPDIAAAIDGGANFTPYQHWVLYGQFEESRPEAVLTNGRTVSEALNPETTPSFSLTEALTAQEAGELPEEYELSDATVDLGVLAVADVAAAQAEAQAIVDGAVNDDQLTLDASYTLEDSVEVLLSEDNAALVAGAAVITVTDETLTREQYDALSQLGNVELEGVEVENTAPEAAETTAEVAEDATFEGQLEATDPDVADLGDELTYALAEGQEEVEGFTLNADGSYTFDAAQEAFQALQAGDTQDIVIAYTVTDSEGATSTSTLTLTVTGTDDAPVVSIEEGTANELLADQVFGDEDAITDVDGFGGGATVTLSYGEAVSAAGQYGTPQFTPTDEFRVVRDGNSFTLIAKAGNNGFETATAIGTVTPVGVAVVEGENSDPDTYTQTGYTLELNGEVTPELLTALLQQWNVQQADDGSNTQLTVSIASEGGAEPVEFVRSINGVGGVTLDSANQDDLEAELTADGDLGTENAETAFAPFGDGVNFNGNVGAIAGMDVTLASTNANDAFAFADVAGFNNTYEVVGSQLIVKAAGIDGDDDLIVADITGLNSNEVTISFRDNLPAGFDQEDIDALLRNLQIDLEDATGDRTVNLDITSGDGLSSDSLTRDISVLGEFTAVDLQAIADADVETDAESVVTIDGNTLLNVNDFGGELDIQAQIDAGNLVIEGSNPIRVIVGAEGADLSEVAGLELLGELQIQTVHTDGILTLDASQVDFLSTSGEVAGKIDVTGLEGNTDADLSVLEAEKGVTATVATGTAEEGSDVTFTGNFGGSTDESGSLQGPEITVTGDNNLIATAAVLSEQRVNGSVVITELDGAAAYNLSELNNATAVLAEDAVTTLNEETDLGDVAVTVPQNSELVLTADQANGANISGGNVTGTGNKGGSVTVLGLADDVDLSNIAGSNILAGAVNASQSDLIVQFRAEDEEAEEAGSDGVITGVDLDDFIVQVQEGATLRIDSNTAHEAVMTGEGNVDVVLHGSNHGPRAFVAMEEPSLDFDLSAIDVTGTKTIEVLGMVNFAEAEVDLGDFRVDVKNDSALFLSAAQADGLDVTGADAVAEDEEAGDEAANGGSVKVLLDGADVAYDLSGISAGAASAEDAEDGGYLLAFVGEASADEVVLDSETDLGDFSLVLFDGLTLTAAQADARAIGGNGNAVTVTGLVADTDLSGIEGASTVIANVAESIDISANENLGNVDTFHVENDASLTLTARQADEQAITAADAIEADEEEETEAQAAGSIVVTGPVEAEEVEEGQVADNAIDLTSIEKPFTFEGGELVVAEGVTVTLTAAQADGKVITGAGNVVVSELGDAEYDLSGITVTGTKTANVEDDEDNAVTLNAATDLGEFTLDVQAGNTLTLSSAQAATAVLVGAGAAVINGTVAGDTLDFSAKSDWTIDTLTINGGGGADVLTAPENVANVTLNGGSNADTFNVASGTVTIGDFTPGVDELVIAADATATITLTADTDLSTTQTAALLSIAETGTLNVDLNGFTLTASPEQLSNITTEGGSISIGELTVAEVKAFGDQNYDLSNADYTLADSAANLLEPSNSTIVTNASGLTVTGTENELSVEEYGKLTGEGQDKLGASFAADATYSLADSTENLAIATEAVRNGAETITIADEASSLNGEVIKLTELGAIDFVDNAATMTAVELQTITGDSENELGLTLTAEDAITVAGVTVTGGDFAQAAAIDLLDTNDTIAFAGGLATLEAANFNDVFGTAGVNATTNDAITVTMADVAVAGTAANDTFDFVGTETSANVTDFGTAGTDTIDLVDVNAAETLTEGPAFAMADNAVFFLGGQAAGSADSAADSATALSAAFNDDVDMVGSFVVIADEDSSAIYAVSNTGGDGNDIVAGDLTLIGTVDAVLTAGNIEVA
ncbi:VCBS domain-containing protein [Halomonas aquamarina]|uniref:beta strand repeat-containing protein n=1 Tax=Vreelandella aquamarina TaxID=77097 RepID=UPI0023584F46|nr:VCBS domain-containing protein [Halomonas aquamarina]MDC8443680.1 VCBS domain-containing protein [Halomonas aquamarina]